eukprot:822747_1
MCDILKMMRCCGTNTEESEEVILSHDLESGVDTTNDGTTADSEIHGFEENVDKSLHASNWHTNTAIRVFAVLAFLFILFCGYQLVVTRISVLVHRQGDTLIHELSDAQTKDQLADLTKRVDAWYKKCADTDGKTKRHVTESLEDATYKINVKTPAKALIEELQNVQYETELDVLKARVRDWAEKSGATESTKLRVYQQVRCAMDKFEEETYSSDSLT